MRCAVVLSGQIQDDRVIEALLRSSDRIDCADGGARHLRRLGILPHALTGDLDSIDPEDLGWLERHQIPLHRFPVEKNETDSELVVTRLISQLSGPPESHEIVLIGALGSRPDHVLANQMMAARLAEKGWRLRLTDGRSDLYTLTGGQHLNLLIDPVDQGSADPAISVIPITREIHGLSYRGLYYSLQNASMDRGSTRGISNQIDSIKLKKAGTTGVPAEITLTEGAALVVVTPAE